MEREVTSASIKHMSLRSCMKRGRHLQPVANKAESETKRTVDLLNMLPIRRPVRSEKKRVYLGSRCMKKRVRDGRTHCAAGFLILPPPRAF